MREGLQEGTNPHGFDGGTEETHPTCYIPWREGGEGGRQGTGPHGLAVPFTYGLTVLFIVRNTREGRRVGGNPGWMFCWNAIGSPLWKGGNAGWLFRSLDTPTGWLIRSSCLHLQLTDQSRV